MRQKFNSADTVGAGFKIKAKPAIPPLGPPQHRFHIVHHGVIQGAPPYKGLDIGKERGAKFTVAANWPGPDKGGTFPCSGN